MEHAAAAGQSEMAGVGGQQVVWPEDVLDQRTHLGHEQQIAEALPLVEQETDVLFLVRSDAAMLELSSAATCSFSRSRKEAAASRPITPSTMQ